MISDEHQELASLHALDLLSAEEAIVFERELASNAELRALVAELREAAAALAHAVPQQAQPPAELKARVMQAIGAEAGTAHRAAPASARIIPFPAWIPWAIAAALALFCGVLAVERTKLRDELARAEAAKPILVALAPGEDGPARAEAMVAWQPDKQSGVIKIRNLPAAAAGKDYQLWAVDAEHKDPIDAGVLRVDADGVVQIEFKPKQAARQVKAFAISLERKGGVPKKEGPILLVGSV